MDDYLELSLASVARATAVVNGGTVDLYENLCEFLVREGLVTTEKFLLTLFDELSDLHSRRDQHSLRVALLQLYAVVKQGEALVHKCCGSRNVAPWPARVLPLLGFKEDVVDIVVHLRWWESVIDMLITRRDEGQSELLKRASQQFEQTLESLSSTSDNEALQAAAVGDKAYLLEKVEELQGSYSGESLGTREAYLLSFQVQSLLTGRDVSGVLELNEYEYKYAIGSGGCGLVNYVEWFGFDCALKVFGKEHVRNEAESLKRCHHPHIVQCYRHWEPENSDNMFHMLMERMPTDLQKYMTRAVRGRTSSSSSSTSSSSSFSPNSGSASHVSESAPFSNPVAIDIMLQVAQAMWHMHSRNVIHRDLKPGNVLVRQVSGDEVPELHELGYLLVKLGDFGLARDDMMSSNDHKLTPYMGTPLYRAPEFCSSEYVLGHNYPRKADVWSFGIMCAELLTGRHPYPEYYPHLRMDELKRKLLNNQIRPQLPEACPDYLKACIESCWRHDPKDRPRFSEIWKVLRFAKLRSLGLLQHNYDLFTFQDYIRRPSNPSPPSTVIAAPPPPPSNLRQLVPEVSQPSLRSRIARVMFGREPIKHAVQRQTSRRSAGPSVHRPDDNQLCYLVNLVSPLELEGNSKLDVIFFEGNVGRRKHLSCKDTWVQRDKPDVWWPQDWLAKDFKGDLRVLVLEYSLSEQDDGRIKAGIDKVVDDLEMLLVFRDRWNRGRTWDRPIVLVGHSLGCIVIEQLVVTLSRRARAVDVLIDAEVDRAKLSRAFLASLAGCFFYAPPLTGLVPSEDLLEHVFGGLSYSWALFANLSCDSPKLRRLTAEFMRARNEKVKLMAVTEGFHTRGRKVVPQGSMQDFGGTFEELEDSNHSDTCKPTNKEHLAYSKLAEFIWDILFVK